MAVEDSGRGFHTVGDREQARLLTDSRAQTFFRVFLAHDSTASEAATELGVDLNAVLYRIKTFLAAGLLQVVREIPRHGRAIKVYRSVHDAYFIPYELTPFATLEERLLQHLSFEIKERARLQAKRMAASGWSGQRLYRNELGETWSDSARGPDSELDWLAPERAGSIDFWTDALLSETEAMEIQKLLYQTLKSVEGRSAGGVGPAKNSAKQQVANERGGDAEPREPLKPYRLSVALLPLEE